MFKKGDMKYKRVGNSGLYVSAISFGFWTNIKSPIQQNLQIVKACLQNGINYFDTAQTYNDGATEEQLGQIFSKLKEKRQNFVISTKIWNSKNPSINSSCNTNKKHIRQSIVQSLKRLQMEYVDIVYAHTFDQNTPLQQICRAFHEIIEQGYAFYWGTSNWDGYKVIQAFQICEKYNLHKPIVAQNQYNMVNRKQIQQQYRPLFQNFGYGLAAYSPLLGGYLTGKYLAQDNQQGRFKVEKTSGWNREELASVYFFDLDISKVDQSLRQLRTIAQQQLKCKLIHLAISWVLKFQYTSTALIGARNVQQLKQILKSLEILDKLTPQLQGRINKILDTHPSPRMNFKAFSPGPHLRYYD